MLKRMPPVVPSAPTFRLLDQGLPHMYLPNVALHPYHGFLQVNTLRLPFVLDFAGLASVSYGYLALC